MIYLLTFLYLFPAIPALIFLRPINVAIQSKTIPNFEGCGPMPFLAFLIPIINWFLLIPLAIGFIFWFMFWCEYSVHKCSDILTNILDVVFLRPIHWLCEIGVFQKIGSFINSLFYDHTK